MKRIYRNLFFVFLSASILFSCGSTRKLQENGTISPKNNQKQRNQKMRQDQKSLKEAKKAFWKAQSKQVRKRIKASNKKIKQNRNSNNYLLY